MADFAEVADTLVSTISAALYPSGTGQASTVGFPVKCFQGWPLAQQIDVDLKAGTGYVSVWPTPTEKPTADHFPDWQQVTAPNPTLTATVAGTAVTIGGTVSTPQAVAIVADTKAYVYAAVQAGDTLASIAAALAAGLTAAGETATSSGAVVTVAGAHSLAARVGGNGVSIRELRRQERVFQIGCWANAPGARDTLAKAVDIALGRNWRITLPDGSMGLSTYRGAVQLDAAEKQLIYRRDLMYGVEYATTETRTDMQVLVDTLALAGAAVISNAIAPLTINS